MEKADLLKPDDKVTITIFGPEGNSLFESTDNGYHTLDQAVNNAISKANLNIDPEDCVIEITNHHTDVTHKYRINAHGHLKLIV